MIIPWHVTACAYIYVAARVSTRRDAAPTSRSLVEL